jgi:hypothetical protein
MQVIWLPPTPNTRIAVLDWTGLENLDSPFCFSCSHIGFGGQLFSGVDYYYSLGFIAAQKSAPTARRAQFQTALSSSSR